MDDKSRRTRNIEQLAAALQDCFDAAVEEGSRRVEKRMNERMERFETRVDRRLDRQDETLRMVWKQVKGEGPLPVDVPD